MYPHGMVHESEAWNRHKRHLGYQLVDSRFTVARVFNLIDLNLIDLNLIEQPSETLIY